MEGGGKREEKRGQRDEQVVEVEEGMLRHGFIPIQE